MVRSPQLVFCLGLILFSGQQASADTTPAQAEFYAAKVRPILEKNCFSCHSHQAKKSRGSLMLDTREALLEGGNAGPAAVPRHPEKSLLVEAISHSKELRMPPKAKLAAADIAILTQWIELGAHYALKEGDKTRPAGRITDEDRKWWAFQPMTKVEPPKVADPIWSAHPVDRFIFTRLAKEGLKPAPAADKRALIRRLSFDLVGLPPTPEEVDAFLKDERPDAYEKLVDRLLASPRFGEHWGRHWLDLVRYAESDGFRADGYRPHVWRYRDYVIAAFNNDKPYDQFVREQLAGDEIAPHDPNVLVATAYLRHGIYEYNQRDARTQWQDMLDDMTSNAGEVFLAMGMHCARCHDHKYDPILQRDYFRLQAFFSAHLPQDEAPLATPAQLAEYRAKLAAWEAKAGAARTQLDEFLKPIKARLEKDAVSKFPRDIQAMLNKPEAERTPLEQQLAALAYRQVDYEFDTIDKHIKDEKSKKRHQELLAALAKVEGDKPAALPAAMTVTDVGPIAPDTLIPKKSAAGPIAPGFLSVLDDKPAVIVPPVEKNSTGRRLTLATWLTRPDHPLTARVYVNRLWQQLLGRGIVGTASDFGKLGEEPTHPELLDWLAVSFVEDGWSTKKTIRRIVLSNTYRQSALVRPAENVKQDPDNRLFWRASTRRLAAEQIRDAIVSATGHLDLKAGGPSVEAKEPRRTVYLKIRRNTRDPLLDVFDAPEGFTSTAKRNVTTTPVQALLMLNSPFMQQEAKSLLARLTKEAATEDERIARAFVVCFGRPADKDDMAATREFLAAQTVRIGGEPTAARRAAWLDFCQAMLSANEFVYID